MLGGGTVGGGGTQAFAMNFNTSTLGDYTAIYTFSVQDVNLPGQGAASNLTLTLHGTVLAIPEPNTSALLTAALLGLIAYAWRKRN
jgi:hypothetical protein